MGGFTLFGFKDAIKAELKRLETLRDMLPEAKPKQSGYVQVHHGRSDVTLRFCHVEKNPEGKRITTSTRLGPSDSEEAKALKEEFYLRELRRRLEMNIKYLERLVSKYEAFDEDSLNDSLPYGLQAVPFEGICMPGEKRMSKEELDAWSRQAYPRNMMTGKHAHYSMTGRVMRSKSEVIIANILDAYDIPYRTEERLELIDESGYKVARFPDFTIMTPGGRKLYWEHFGLLNQDEYSAAAVDKIKLYALNGIIPGRNLVISAESHYGEIDSGDIINIVENCIMKYF